MPVKRGWVGKNPCKAIDRVTMDAKPPEILTVDQAKAIMEHVSKTMPQFLPWMTLALFAGTRPFETDRLTWADIDLDRGIVTVDSSASKLRQRRIVDLEPCAIAWLKKGGTLPLSTKARHPLTKAIKKLMGWKKYKKDILRHTAASMMIAKHKDVAEVSLQLGNSPDILFLHYRELVTKVRRLRAFGRSCRLSSHSKHHANRALKD